MCETLIVASSITNYNRTHFHKLDIPQLVKKKVLTKVHRSGVEIKIFSLNPFISFVLAIFEIFSFETVFRLQGMHSLRKVRFSQNLPPESLLKIMIIAFIRIDLLYVVRNAIIIFGTVDN